MITLAADIGGTRIKLAIMKDGAVLLQNNFETDSRKGLARQLPLIARSFDDLCTESGVKRNECSAVAIAFPSLIDAGRGRVLTSYGKYMDAPNLDLSQWSQDTFGLPLVIENDARAALLGEWRAGAGRGCDDLVMVTLGTGLGTSALMGGHLVRGRHGQAGVLGGHFTVSQNGRSCTCGNRGCAEAEASTFALPKIAVQRADFAASPLRDASVIDYAAVLRLSRDKDPCAIALRTVAIEVWTALIVNLIHAYDPERVIVGGGIVAGAEDFMAELEHHVHDRAHTPWGRVAMLPAELGDAAALFGGEFLVHEKIRSLQ